MKKRAYATSSSLYLASGGRMIVEMTKKAARKRKPKADLVVPPLAVGFEEAVSRLLRVKPPARKAARKKASPKT